MRAIPVIAALVLASALPCHAGYMIKSTTTHLQTGMTGEMTMLVDGPNLHTKGSHAGMDSEMIFRGKERKVWQIMPGQKKVMEMTEESGAAMAEQMDAAMQEMQKQMADMPPAQRAMMEKMMPKSMQKKPAAEPVSRVEKTGNTQEVDGIECRQYDYFVDDEKQSEIFVAPWGKVDAGPDSIEAMIAMGKFMTKMMSKMKSASAPSGFPDLSDIDGYPVLIRTFKDGVATVEARNAPPIKQDVPAATFELPAGYEVVDPMAVGAGF